MLKVSRRPLEAKRFIIFKYFRFARRPSGPASRRPYLGLALVNSARPIDQKEGEPRERVQYHVNNDENRRHQFGARYVTTGRERERGGQRCASTAQINGQSRAGSF